MKPGRGSGLASKRERVRDAEPSAQGREVADREGADRAAGRQLRGLGHRRHLQLPPRRPRGQGGRGGGLGRAVRQFALAPAIAALAPVGPARHLRADARRRGRRLGPQRPDPRRRLRVGARPARPLGARRGGGRGGARAPGLPGAGRGFLGPDVPACAAAAGPDGARVRGADPHRAGAGDPDGGGPGRGGGAAGRGPAHRHLSRRAAQRQRHAPAAGAGARAPGPLRGRVADVLRRAPGHVPHPRAALGRVSACRRRETAGRAGAAGGRAARRLRGREGPLHHARDAGRRADHLPRPDRRRRGDRPAALGRGDLRVAGRGAGALERRHRARRGGAGRPARRRHGGGLRRGGARHRRPGGAARRLRHLPGARHLARRHAALRGGARRDRRAPGARRALDPRSRDRQRDRGTARRRQAHAGDRRGNRRRPRRVRGPRP